MTAQINIGKKIANYRRMHGITISELADRTGVSPALISQLERGIGNPTINALSALADGMGIMLSDLVATQVENCDLICRKKDRVTVLKEDYMLMQSVLVEAAVNTSLSVHMIELQPHSCSNEAFDVHLDEECLLVLEGELFVMFEDEGFLLQKGDSIRVLPNRLHTIYNHGDSVACAMNIKCKVQY